LDTTVDKNNASGQRDKSFSCIGGMGIYWLFLRNSKLMEFKSVTVAKCIKFKISELLVSSKDPSELFTMYRSFFSSSVSHSLVIGIRFTV